MVEDIKDEFFEGSINTYDGKIYGLPIQESSAGFYYNKDLFKKAGISDDKVNPSVVVNDIFSVNIRVGEQQVVCVSYF